MKTKRKDWKPAIEKVREEGCCRVCGISTRPLDPAHIVGRGVGGSMDPLNIIPLCRDCHTSFDGGTLDILPYLNFEEQVQAVREAGSIARAYRRLTSGTDRNI